MADQIEEQLGGLRKSGKQCRERWYNHLDPKIVKKQWTFAQQNILFQKHRQHGNKWIQIAQSMPGRTDNSIKNHFYSTIRKSLRRINKFLGSKDGTKKIKQIKPSTLSQIFSHICSDSPQPECLSEPASVSNKKTEHLQRQKKGEKGGKCQRGQKVERFERDDKKQSGQFCREIAYDLIDFSRGKLGDKQRKLNQHEIQRLERLLEEVERINQNRHNSGASSEQEQSQIKSANKQNKNSQQIYEQVSKEQYQKLLSLSPEKNPQIQIPEYQHQHQHHQQQSSIQICTLPKTYNGIYNIPHNIEIEDSIPYQVYFPMQSIPEIQAGINFRTPDSVYKERVWQEDHHDQFDRDDEMDSNRDREFKDAEAEAGGGSVSNTEQGKYLY